MIRLKNSDGRLIDYDDTEETIRMRTRLGQWNEFIMQQHHVDLLLKDDELEKVFETNRDDEEEEKAFWQEEQQPSYVELNRVRLHRVFNNGSFEQGGRFYGGWWQSIPSKYRPCITINGHATREFDYSNLHAAILYAQVGLPLQDDAYVKPRSWRSFLKSSIFCSIFPRAIPRMEGTPPSPCYPGEGLTPSGRRFVPL